MVRKEGKLFRRELLSKDTSRNRYTKSAELRNFCSLRLFIVNSPRDWKGRSGLPALTWVIQLSWRRMDLRAAWNRAWIRCWPSRLSERLPARMCRRPHGVVATGGAVC